MTRQHAHAFVLTAMTAALLSACGGGGGMSVGSSGMGNCEVDPYTGQCRSGSGTGFGGAGGGNYIANALVTDASSSIQALHNDPELVNAWGLAFNPQGYSWVANAGTATSTLYDGNGVPQPLIVSIPAGAVGNGNPAGIVFNGTTDFAITANGSSGAAPFIFATLEGQIAAWSPGVDGTHAFTIVDNGSAGAAYTGLAIETGANGDRLYAADFAHGRIDTFDGSFAPAGTSGGFVDPTLPSNYAPFGIQQIGGRIYVAYAQVDDATGEEVHAAGAGLVDVFDAQGNLLSHLIPAGGALDAPWGLAMAPANFGKFSNMLLVGNFGDGMIHAYDPSTGAPQGTVSNNDGSPIVIDGLWALQFGNGLNSQPTNTLFYTAGPEDEEHGLYGRIDMN